MADQEAPPWETISTRQRQLIFSGSFLCLILYSLDTNLLMVSLPKITEDLGHQELLSWVIASEALTRSAFSPLYGRFSDIYGRRRVYLCLLIVFIGGSAFGGFGKTIWMVIIGRGIQGLGGGGLFALAVIVIGDIFPPQDRPKAMSSLAFSTAFSSVLGPIIGGAFTDHLSWRWNFYLCLPLGGIALLVLFFSMKYESPRMDKPLDVVGAFLVAVATTCCLLFASWGGIEYPWDSPVILGLIAGTVLFSVLFIIQELRHPLPMLNLHLFRGRVFVMLCVVIFMSFVVIMGSLIFMPFYFQEVKGDSAIASGLKGAPFSGGMIIAAAGAGSYISKSGQAGGLLPAGSFFSAAGLTLLILISPDVQYWKLLVGLVLMGFGMGLILPVVTTVAQSTLPREDMANGLSAIRFFQNLGGAVGAAVLGALVQDSLATRQEQTGDRKEAIAYAVSRVFLVGAVAMTLTLLFTFLLPSLHLFDPKPVMLVKPDEEEDEEDREPSLYSKEAPLLKPQNQSA